MLGSSSVRVRQCLGHSVLQTPIVVVDIISREPLPILKQTGTMQTEVCVNYLNNHIHVPSKHIWAKSHHTYAGVRLQGDWGKIVAPEGSKLPWEALRVITTSLSRLLQLLKNLVFVQKELFC